jgi:hypothetical protein
MYQTVPFPIMTHFFLSFASTGTTKTLVETPTDEIEDLGHDMRDSRTYFELVLVLSLTTVNDGQ